MAARIWEALNGVGRRWGSAGFALSWSPAAGYSRSTPMRSTRPGARQSHRPHADQGRRWLVASRPARPRPSVCRSSRVATARSGEGAVSWVDVRAKVRGRERAADVLRGPRGRPATRARTWRRAHDRSELPGDDPGLGL